MDLGSLEKEKGERGDDEEEEADVKTVNEGHKGWFHQILMPHTTILHDKMNNMLRNVRKITHFKKCAYVDLLWVKCVILCLITEVRVPGGSSSRSESLHLFIVPLCLYSLLILFYFPFWDLRYKSYFSVSRLLSLLFVLSDSLFLLREKSPYKNGYLPMTVPKI